MGMINTEQIEKFLGVEKSNCHSRKYGDERTPYDNYGNGFGDGKGECHGMQYSDGHDLGNGHGIAEIEGYKIYKIDSIPTIITAIHGNIAQDFILHMNTYLKPCYVVKGNDQFAHGKTLHEAYEALQGKLFTTMTEEERIKVFIEKFSEYDTLYSNKDFYIYHNRLTGSCKMGRLVFKSFHELSLESKMTVRQFVALTEDEYQGDIIKNYQKHIKMLAREFKNNKNLKIMTKEEIKEYLPYIEVIAKGKTVQVMVSKNSSGITWQDVDAPEFIKGHLYRIKPDTEYRPFTSKEEGWNEMLKHSPFGWVTDGDSNYNISLMNDRVVVVGDCEASIWTRSYTAALNALKFVDGEPFGIKE